MKRSKRRHPPPPLFHTWVSGPLVGLPSTAMLELWLTPAGPELRTAGRAFKLHPGKLP